METSKSEQRLSKQTSSPGKTSKAYWLKKVFLPSYTRGGKEAVSDSYAAQITWGGERHKIGLGLSDKEEAAKKAARIYKHLQGHGWLATLERFSPRNAPKPEPKAKPVTLGEFIAEAEKVASVNPRTFHEYALALRRIYAEALDITPPSKGTVGAATYTRKSGKRKGQTENLKGKTRELSKFDYRSPARREWIARIEKLPLARLTPAKVQAWKVAYVKRNGTDPVKETSSKRSANATLRQAKSLFSPKQILPHLGAIELPSPLPFAGVTLFSRKELGKMRYQSTFDAGDLVSKAASQLPTDRPEEWKVFLLAIGAGLRRNEIDKLLWRQIDLDEAIIRIEATPYFQPKSAESAGAVEIDAELVSFLRPYKAKATGDFVIESNRPPIVGASYATARASKVFASLYQWLREEGGITDQKPLHTLRKEFGSLLCQQSGLYAASRALRHADISITAEHYLDKKERVTVGLGAFLRPENEVEFPKLSATS